MKVSEIRLTAKQIHKMDICSKGRGEEYSLRNIRRMVREASNGGKEVSLYQIWCYRIPPEDKLFVVFTRVLLSSEFVDSQYDPFMVEFLFRLAKVFAERKGEEFDVYSREVFNSMIVFHEAMKTHSGTQKEKYFAACRIAQIAEEKVPGSEEFSWPVEWEKHSIADKVAGVADYMHFYGLSHCIYPVLETMLYEASIEFVQEKSDEK